MFFCVTGFTSEKFTDGRVIPVKILESTIYKTISTTTYSIKRNLSTTTKIITIITRVLRVGHLSFTFTPTITIKIHVPLWVIWYVHWVVVVWKWGTWLRAKPNTIGSGSISPIRVREIKTIHGKDIS
jgi:hypothetical protein